MWGDILRDFFLRTRGIPTLPDGMVRDILLPPSFGFFFNGGGGVWWSKLKSSLMKWSKKRENVSHIEDI